MGHYSELFIGRLYLSWKNYIPAFLTFLFDEEDYYVKRDPEDEEYFEEIGYKTTCARSISVLEKFGYTLEFFSQIYEFFYPGLYRTYEYLAKEQIVEDAGDEIDKDEIDKRFAGHIESFPRLSRLEEIQDFIKFLSVLFQTDFKTPPFDKPYKLSLQDGREYFIDSEEYFRTSHHSNPYMIDFESLQMYVLNKYLRFPPWILLLCNLFEEDYFFEYPEIISLMFVRLALSAVNPENEIKLDLHDIIEEEKEVRELHVNLANSLVGKVNLYNKVFRTLFIKEDEIRTRYIKTECRDLLEACDKASSKSEKGHLLEHLTELVFTSNNSLELVNKRVSTGDEEIDLVVKNNVDRPFWLAFNSPLFFIECKNWNSTVGPKELRDFEVKLRNHGTLAKIGFFISLNGFTSGFENELKRLGRDQYHIVPIDRKDIEDYISNQLDFFVWLESRTVKLH